MRPLSRERQQATVLRRRGLSYSEIQKQIPVSQSSLSGWLHSVHLSERQKERLREKKLEGGKAGSKKLQERRVQRLAQENERAVGEGRQYLHARDVRWLTGVIFYWAEGSKPKPWNHHERLTFTNADVTTVLIMRGWLQRYCAVRSLDILYDLYIHPGANVRRAQRFWLAKLNLERRRLRTYFKKANRSPKRRNVGKEYYGTMRMRVRRSMSLNHRVSGWIQAVAQHCGVV
jgi:transposase